MNGLHVQMQPVRFKVERCEAVQQRSPDCLLQDLSLPHCAKQWAKRLDGVVPSGVDLRECTAQVLPVAAYLSTGRQGAQRQVHEVH